LARVTETCSTYSGVVCKLPHVVSCFGPHASKRIKARSRTASFMNYAYGVSQLIISWHHHSTSCATPYATPPQSLCELMGRLTFKLLQLRVSGIACLDPAKQIGRKWRHGTSVLSDTESVFSHAVTFCVANKLHNKLLVLQLVHTQLPLQPKTADPHALM
jgi:hypothetical protein